MSTIIISIRPEYLTESGIDLPLFADGTERHTPANGGTERIPHYYSKSTPDGHTLLVVPALADALRFAKKDAQQWLAMLRAELGVEGPTLFLLHDKDIGYSCSSRLPVIDTADEKVYVFQHETISDDFFYWMGWDGDGPADDDRTFDERWEEMKKMLKL